MNGRLRAFVVLALACIALGAGATGLAGPPLYSAAALYNAGNAAARAGELPRAILDYERALVLAPHDADVQANLHMVQVRAGAASVADRDWRRVPRLAPPALMLSAGLVGLLLLATAWLARELVPRGRVPLGLAAGAGALLLALTLLDALATAPLLGDAVTLKPCAAAASPTPNGEPLFTLPGGETVTIESSHGEFALIRDAQGREGWVAGAALERVVPAEAGS